MGPVAVNLKALVRPFRRILCVSGSAKSSREREIEEMGVGARGGCL
jgi:hypothetical protein